MWGGGGGCRGMGVGPIQGSKVKCRGQRSNVEVKGQIFFSSKFSFRKKNFFVFLVKIFLLFFFVNFFLRNLASPQMCLMFDVCVEVKGQIQRSKVKCRGQKSIFFSSTIFFRQHFFSSNLFFVNIFCHFLFKSFTFTACCLFSGDTYSLANWYMASLGVNKNSCFLRFSKFSFLGVWRPFWGHFGHFFGHFH